MQNPSRPLPRMASHIKIMTILAGAALLGVTSHGAAVADTGDLDVTAPDQKMRVISEVEGLVSVERLGLSSFAETANFRRVAGLPQADMSIDAPSTAPNAPDAIEELAAHDADAATHTDKALNAQQAELVTVDKAGNIDLAAIRHVKVGAPTPSWTCLSEALYHEARGETLIGQVAVAEVILNRVDSRKFPNSVCGVIQQGESRGKGCQFSYRCDGHSDTMNETKAIKQVRQVAWVMLQGKPRIVTGDATHYHSTAVKPGWSKRLLRTARIGDHIFYRPKLRVSSTR